MVRSPFPFFVIMPTRWRNMQVSASTPAGIRMGIQHRSAASAERYGLGLTTPGKLKVVTVRLQPPSSRLSVLPAFSPGQARQSPATLSRIR